MASKPAESPSLYGNIICQICSKPYSDPRILGCLHSFCKECLKKEVEKAGSQSTLECPSCKRSVFLPPEGVDAVPQNLRLGFHVEISNYKERIETTSNIDCDGCVDTSSGSAIVFCVQCCEFLCKPCSNHHRRSRKTLKHELVTVGEKKQLNVLQSLKPREFYCSQPDHENEVLKFYCETCRQLVCRDCVLVDHKEHKHTGVAAIAGTHREEMKALLEPASDAISALEIAKGASDKVVQQVRNRTSEVQESIEKAFAEVERALKARKEALMQKTSEISISKTTALALRREELQQCQDDLQSYVDVINGTLQSHTDKEILALGGLLQRELQASIRRFKDVSLTPAKSCFMQVKLPTATLCESISKFGEVSGGSFASQTIAQLWLPRAVKGKERRVKVVTKTASGDSFGKGGEQVRGELRLMGSSNPRIMAQTTDHGDGTYTLVFTPKEIGEHSLSLSVEDELIRGSPFVISVREPRSYDCLRQTQQTFSCSNPRSVAVHDSGDIYICTYNNAIQIFHGNGTSKGTIGSSGSGNCQFSNPWDIAISGEVMYIADYGNHRVQKLSISGNFISQFGQYGTGEGQLYSPVGLALDMEGRVYVAENGNHRVSVFSGDGTFLHTIPRDTSQENHINSPQHLAFGPNGNLHIVSYGTSCIAVYTSDGQFVEKYGNGQFSYPYGIVVDEEGYSLVSEANGTNSYIWVFDPAHQSVQTKTGFYNLYGMALSKEGSVFMADYSNGRVLKY